MKNERKPFLVCTLIFQQHPQQAATPLKVLLLLSYLEPSAIVALATDNAARDTAADQSFSLFFAVEVLGDDLVENVEQCAVHVVVVDDRHQIVSIVDL